MISLRSTALVGSLSRGSGLSPSQALVADLLAYAPSLLLVADLGTLQGDGSPCVAGDPLSAACATWQDQSGQGNHATQATVTARPRLTAGGIGGRLALILDGTDDCMAGICPDGDALVWVARADASGSGAVWSDTAGGTHHPWTDGTAYDFLRSELRADSIVAPGGYYRWLIYSAARSSANSLVVRVDGAVVATRDGPGRSATDYIVGRDGTASTYYYAGQVGSIYVGSAATLAAVTSRLAAYYGITLTA